MLLLACLPVILFPLVPCLSDHSECEGVDISNNIYDSIINVCQFAVIPAFVSRFELAAWMKIASLVAKILPFKPHLFYNTPQFSIDCRERAECSIVHGPVF